MEGLCRGCLIRYDDPMDILQYTEKYRRLFVYSTGLQVSKHVEFIITVKLYFSLTYNFIVNIDSYSYPATFWWHWWEMSNTTLAQKIYKNNLKVLWYCFEIKHYWRGAFWVFEYFYLILSWGWLFLPFHIKTSEWV